MSVPGFPAERNIHDLGDPRLELAFQEGHDADIPSNEGVYEETKGSSRKSVDQADLDRDLEKGENTSTAAANDERKTQVEEQAVEQDPNIVWWDGDNDPENPMNWTAKKKWSNLALLSIMTLVTPLGSSMFAPGVPSIMREFHSTNTQLATFVVSVYILGFAFGPLVVAPLSEMYGRTPLYNMGNGLFVVFSVGSALSHNMGMLVAFRFLMGCAGCVPVTLGGGTIADVMPVEKRGSAMAIWSMGPLLGPVIGPVAGGYLIEAKGWRWVFWLLTIISGFFFLLSVFLLKETYAPVLLERKAARLRKETGNSALKSKLDTGLTPVEIFKRSIIRPLKMLFTIPTIFLLALYVAVAYGILYLLFTTYTFVFEEHYGFSSGSVGLTYIPSGIGMILGMGVIGFCSDKILQKRKALGKPIRPEHRLPIFITLPGGLALPIGLFIYGWTAEKHVHWIVPLIGTVFVGAGLLANMVRSLVSFSIGPILSPFTY